MYKWKKRSWMWGKVPHDAFCIYLCIRYLGDMTLWLLSNTKAKLLQWEKSVPSLSQGHQEEQVRGWKPGQKVFNYNMPRIRCFHTEQHWGFWRRIYVSGLGFPFGSFEASPAHCLIQIKPWSIYYLKDWGRHFLSCKLLEFHLPHLSFHLPHLSFHLSSLSQVSG